jgi:NNP family nitrate/nitrite transporter-like MFS transporter
MFDLNVVGVANATSAGWGNLGGGVAQLLNTAIYKACKGNGMTNDSSWRATCAWSPAVILCLGVAVFFFSDDCPYGNFKDLKTTKSAEEKAAEDKAALETGGEPGTVAAKSLIAAACSWQTWVLHACYMFSFGVELIVNGNIVTYFVETFGMAQTDAGFIGSIFGFLNIFARSLGGYWSDLYCIKWGVRGRIWALFQQTFVMGVCLISFSTLTRDGTGIGGMIINLVFWGIFTNMTEGGTFAVVPYVLPTAVGGVAGIVGAGGNVGALLGNFLIVMLKGKAGPKPARMLMFCCLGWGALASSLLLPCLWLPGIGSMFRAADAAPASDEEAAQEKTAPVAPSQMTGPMPTFVPMQAPQ